MSRLAKAGEEDDRRFERSPSQHKEPRHLRGDDPVEGGEVEIHHETRQNVAVGAAYREHTDGDEIDSL